MKYDTDSTGKKIEEIKYFDGESSLALFFTDGTYHCFHASTRYEDTEIEAMDEADITMGEKKELGVISEEEYKDHLALQSRRSVESQEKRDVENYERLKKKLGK